MMKRRLLFDWMTMMLMVLTGPVERKNYDDDKMKRWRRDGDWCEDETHDETCGGNLLQRLR